MAAEKDRLMAAAILAVAREAEGQALQSSESRDGGALVSRS